MGKHIHELEKQIKDLKHVQEGNECVMKWEADRYNELMNKLHNWQIGAVAAGLMGLALGMTVVGIAYTGGW